MEQNKEEPRLVQKPEGLTLVWKDMELRGDFALQASRRASNGAAGELLVKAARLKGLDHEPVAVDATAGLGEDSFLLACAGFTVHLCEHDPQIAALLEDAHERAGASGELSGIMERMIIHRTDSREFLQSSKVSPDLVLLDPMFPERRKSSLVKKKLQMLQQLEAPCDDEAGLLQAALLAKPKKIIIKRPLKGPYLAGVSPSYSIKGKKIRYDCILL